MTKLILSGAAAAVALACQPIEAAAYESAAPVEYSLAVGESRLAYTKSGSGPTIVVVHGIGGDKGDWRAVAANLSVRHTVYTIDLLGFGASSKNGETITIPDQARAILALLDKEGVQRTDLIGNSVGGWVSATFAAAYPDRTRKLVLVDAAGFEAMFEGESPVNFYPTSLEDARKLTTYTRHAPPADAAERALARVAANGEAQAAAAVWKGLFASERLEPVVSRVAAPTLVVWGAEDKLFPPVIADLIVSRLPSGRKVLIPGASHFPQLDAPEVFTSTVAAFLAD